MITMITITTMIILIIMISASLCQYQSSMYKANISTLRGSGYTPTPRQPGALLLLDAQLHTFHADLLHIQTGARPSLPTSWQDIHDTNKIQSNCMIGSHQVTCSIFGK